MINENRQLAVFRVKVTDILGNYADRMKIFVTENVAMGIPVESVRAIIKDPLSKWAMERETMIKHIKREVAGLVNRVHIAGYLKEGVDA